MQLDVAAPREPAALESLSSRIGRLLDAIGAVYRPLGFDKACGGDAVFEQLDGPDHRADQKARREPGVGRGRAAGLVVSDGEATAFRLAGRQRPHSGGSVSGSVRSGLVVRAPPTGSVTSCNRRTRGWPRRYLSQVIVCTEAGHLRAQHLGGLSHAVAVHAVDP